jgi:hypothetical protein
MVGAVLIPGASPLRKEIVDALGHPGDWLSQWIYLPDILPLLVGSFLFYFAIFWVVLYAWAAARARFGTGGGSN